MRIFINILKSQLLSYLKPTIIVLLITALIILCIEIAPPGDSLREDLGDDFEEWNNNRFANRHSKLMIFGICIITLILLTCLVIFCAKDLIK